MKNRTYGPWDAMTLLNGAVLVETGTGKPVASVQAIGPANQRFRANVDLIVAAPKLLAALKAVVGADHAGEATFAWAEARAAIAAAEGRGQQPLETAA